MFKYFMTSVLAAGCVALAAAASAAPAERGKPEQACEKQQQQCMKQCDKEKTLWLFKGEAFESCAAKCDARQTECLATGTTEHPAVPATERANERAPVPRDESDATLDEEAVTEEEIATEQGSGEPGETMPEQRRGDKAERKDSERKDNEREKRPPPGDEAAAGDGTGDGSGDGSGEGTGKGKGKRSGDDG